MKRACESRWPNVLYCRGLQKQLPSGVLFSSWVSLCKHVQATMTKCFKAAESTSPAAQRFVIVGYGLTGSSGLFWIGVFGNVAVNVLTFHRKRQIHLCSNFFTLWDREVLRTSRFTADRRFRALKGEQSMPKHTGQCSSMLYALYASYGRPRGTSKPNSNHLLCRSIWCCVQQLKRTTRNNSTAETCRFISYTTHAAMQGDLPVQPGTCAISRPARNHQKQQQQQQPA